MHSLMRPRTLPPVWNACHAWLRDPAAKTPLNCRGTGRPRRQIGRAAETLVQWVMPWVRLGLVLPTHPTPLGTQYQAVPAPTSTLSLRSQSSSDNSGDSSVERPLVLAIPAYHTLEPCLSPRLASGHHLRSRLHHLGPAACQRLSSSALTHLVGTCLPWCKLVSPF